MYSIMSSEFLVAIKHISQVHCKCAVNLITNEIMNLLDHVEAPAASSIRGLVHLLHKLTPNTGGYLHKKYCLQNHAYSASTFAPTMAQKVSLVTMANSFILHISLTILSFFNSG